MAPGPMTAVTVGKGSKSPHAGALVAIGHGIVEVPLILMIFFGFGGFLDTFYVKFGLGIAGGLFLLVMGIDMFRSFNKVEIDADKYRNSSIVSGILLSIWNPYFFIWWATVGAMLVTKSVMFGLTGLIVFIVVHWLCDFSWSYFLSILSYNGGKFFGNKFQKTVFIACGIMLVLLSCKFIIDSVKLL
jgi:threonine/homoserine/homoserine lactone efflux protein